MLGRVLKLRKCVRISGSINIDLCAFRRQGFSQVKYENFKIDDRKLKMDFLVQALKSNDVSSVDDIENLKTSSNSNAFDSLFLTACEMENALPLGRMYTSYIFKNGNISLGVAGKYFRLCYSCKKDVTNEDIQLIYSIYEYLLNKYEVFDWSTCENAALALSLTDRWKEVENMIKMSTLTSTPSNKMYSALVLSALDHGDEEYAWNTMDITINNGKSLHDSVFSELLKINNGENIFKLLSWLQSHNLQISQEIAPEFADCYKKFTKGKVRHSKINSRGQCGECRTQLPDINITEDEFNLLKDHFLKPVLIGKDVFLKTKPEELKTFFKFINDTGPIDVVLDGLNVAYSIGTTKGSPSYYSNMLKHVVQHFRNQSKKIIILGRNHMKKWPNMNYIHNNAHVFLTDNVSFDDPFLLFAAMNSGLGTIYVSKDEMRGHKFLLKSTKLRKIFVKWQQKHQYYLKYVTPDGKVYLRTPLPFLKQVQESNNTWHLPIFESKDGRTIHNVTMDTTWLCLT